MEDGNILKCVAVISITAMEVAAMALLHIDGAFLAACVGAIAGIAGYEIGVRKVTTK